MLCSKRIREIEKQASQGTVSEEDMKYLLHAATLALELQEQSELKNRLIIRLANKQKPRVYSPTTS